MAYLDHIIRQIESVFHIHVHGQYHSRADIEGIRFLTALAQTIPEPEDGILYIRHTEEMITIFVSESGCLCIQKDLAAEEVFNVIQSVILKHHTLKAKREELFQSLHSDHGMLGMAHTAHSFLNNPITVCDTSFAVIAASPIVNDQRNLEEMHGRLYLKDDLIQDMTDRGIIEHLYSSSLPCITSLQDFPYKWVFESIRIRHAVVGYICVRGTVRDFTEDDMEYIDVFAKMLSIEMQKDSSFSYPTGLKYEYFLTELLEGHFERTEYITGNLLRLRHNQMAFYTVIVLQMKHMPHEKRQFKGYFSQLLSILPGCMPVLFRGDLTILLPGNTRRPFTEKSQNKFATFLKLNHMLAFISYPYTDISKSSIYYRQTKDISMLYKGIDTYAGDEECFVYYEKCFLEQTLYQCPDAELLSASIHPDVIQMVDFDRVSNTEYARTLRVYLTKNRNAAAAANELHIHKSTFFYRLGKMGDLFQIDVNDGLALFAYEYSFRVLDYLREKE